jgi:pyruvate/2-oxoglutarate dehydrogenase complex dihydrolipoamide acyltransferase (E2) component
MESLASGTLVEIVAGVGSERAVGEVIAYLEGG